MKKYVAERSNIYVGKLKLITELNSGIISPFDMIENIGYCFNSNSVVTLVCRSMLYAVVNDEAFDLVYDSPICYPIDEFTPFKKGFIVSDSINLNIILEYLKFKEFLTQADIIRIFKMFVARNDFFSPDSFFSKIARDCYGEKFEAILNQLLLIGNCEHAKPVRYEPYFPLAKKK